MDALSSVLELVRLSSTVYFRSDFSAPWGMQVNQGPFAQFHMLTQGRCLLKTGGNEIGLEAGDIVIFPHGDAHSLVDKNGSNAVDGMKVVQSIMQGQSIFTGDNVVTSMICGHFQYDRSSPHQFTQELPSLIYIPDNDRRSLSWLMKITELILDETQSKNEGSETIVNKLSEALFVHAIRAYMHLNTPDRGFLAAMKDERIARALKAIHGDHQRTWTVADIAQEAGMSRTAFSNQFKELMGETPMVYLSNWRITKAKELLTYNSAPISHIAHAVGYRSEAAFIKVFKKSEALTPLKYRQGVA